MSRTTPSIPCHLRGRLRLVRCLVWLVLPLSLLGCGRAYRFGLLAPHPAIRDTVRSELRTAGGLEPDCLTMEHAPALDEAPLEPADEIVARARAITAAGNETQVVNLALPESRCFALRYNLNLQVDLFNPTQAQEGYESELWKFESVLAASQTLATRIDPLQFQPGVLEPRGEGLETDVTTLETGIRVPTRLGGVGSVTLPLRRTDADFAIPPVNPGDPVITGDARTDAQGLIFNLNQPLLRNAGAFVNHASINNAGLLMMQADARTRLSAIRVLANAEQAYWRLYFFHENLRIQLDLYDQALAQLRMSKRLVEEGVRTKVETLRAESGVAQRYEQVVLAELNRRIAERALKRVMNSPDLPVEDATIVVPSTPPAPRGYVFDRPQVLQIAFDNRMELVDNELQQEIDQLSIGVNRNLILPDVRFDFRYSFAGEGSNFSDAYDRLFSPEFNDYTVGLFSEIPLNGNQAARARWRQSVLTLSQTQAFRRAISIGVAEEVENSLDSVEQTWHRILANRIAVDAARRTYEAERIQFELGESTNTDVFVQLSNLAQAEQLLIQSISDFHVSVVDLAFSTGTILGQGGVIWGAPSSVPCAAACDPPLGPCLPEALFLEQPSSLVPGERVSPGVPPGATLPDPMTPPPSGI